jgi:dolichol-phosphate mannosyltransferase
VRCPFRYPLPVPPDTGVPGERTGWLRWLALFALVRLLLGAFLPVVTDEAYHWNFACHLDWGYFDHPPMIAWAIALGRALFGDTPLGVHFVPVLLSIGTAALVAGLAAGDRAARWTILLVFASPLLFWVGASATPDAPLLFFWALAMATTWKATQTGRLRWWLAAGVALGGALLSKYTAVLLVPSVLGYVLCSREHRRLLAIPGPYVAVLLAALAFLPVVLWNAHHDWASLKFQILRRMEKERSASAAKLGEFLVVQVGGYLPLLVPLAVVWVRRSLRRTARAKDRYLLWCAVPTILFFLALSPTRGIPANWTIPAYLALTVGMAVVAATPEGRVTRAYAARPRRLLILMTIVYAVGATGVAMFARRLQPDFYAWDAVCREARSRREGMPESTFYLGLGRTFVDASQLAFHLKAPDEVYAKNLLGDEGMQYDFWVNPRDLEGRDAVVVMEEKDYDRRWQDVQRRFRSVEPPFELRVPVPFGKDIRFYIARAEGYIPP